MTELEEKNKIINDLLDAIWELVDGFYSGDEAHGKMMEFYDITNK